MPMAAYALDGSDPPFRLVLLNSGVSAAPARNHYRARATGVGEIRTNPNAQPAARPREQRSGRSLHTQ